MLEVRDECGDIQFYHLNAENDTITCPACRVCVPQGHICPCPMRTKGPMVENITRKTLTGELGAKAAE